MKRLALLSVLLLPSCVMTPSRGAAGHSSGVRQFDPMKRTPAGLWEVDRVAREVAAVTGRRVAGPIEQSYLSNGPVASIHETPEGDRITVNPRAAQEIPVNAWAFIFGHEFAHQVYNFGHRGNTDPAKELRADIIGARFAKEAGYELVPYLHWMLSRPPDSSPSHGDLHWRAREMARYFKITTSIESSYR